MNPGCYAPGFFPYTEILMPLLTDFVDGSLKERNSSGAPSVNQPIYMIVPCIPLRSYVASLADCVTDEQREKRYAQLVDLAQDKKLTGAFKQGRIWFINQLALAQKGLESNAEDLHADRTEQPKAEGAPERHRKRSPKTQTLVRADAGVRLRRRRPRSWPN